ncbi:hypothetical protein BAE44_0004503, partial [Dichanthelium oligosanthes]
LPTHYLMSLPLMMCL